MLCSTSRLPAVKRTGALLSWSIDDPRELEREISGPTLVSAVPFLTMLLLVERMARSRLQARLYGLFGRSRFVNHMVQHLRYRF
jgi:hypothetical protein